jgi:hypothetical protein
MTEPVEDVARVEAEIWGRSRGVMLVLALHVAFTLMTVVIAFVVPLDDFQPMDLIEPWAIYLGVVQGIYVIPTALTLGLMQRWQMLIGVGMAAGITVLATLAALGLARLGVF